MTQACGANGTFVVTESDKIQWQHDTESYNQQSESKNVQNEKDEEDKDSWFYNFKSDELSCDGTAATAAHHDLSPVSA